MSKDNPNLRLLGSPVNLSYRGKKNARNIRNRPRSALQNSCYNPDNQERFRRPFSADTNKDRSSSNKPFFKSYSSEVLEYDPPITTIRILPPTTELLGGSTSLDRHSINRDNASDYGSEDTFISLGTKIKAKAQSGTKPKTSTAKLKVCKKTKKPTDDKPNEQYGMEIKISERSYSPVPKSRSFFRERVSSPSKTGPYGSYFIPLNSSNKDVNDLSGRVSFGNSSIHAEVEEAIDTYSRRLTINKQLSLVEEESTQDIESVPSQQMPSLSPENSLEEPKKDENVEDILTGRNTYILDNDDYPKVENYDDNFNKSENFNSRTYSSFYDDFNTATLNPYKDNMASTVVHTDSSSKDSGYPESGVHDEKSFKQDYLLHCNALKKSNSSDKVEIPSKSLDDIQINCIKSYSKTFPPHKTQYGEPLNHSRLLYKDFFLKKEGHIALPPQNSPTGVEQVKCPSDPGPSQVDTNKNERPHELEYPSYLVNSTTKAYTSKVIEDYRKELEAINNLHELTLKDLKTDAISPTPLNIDKMFETHSTRSSESSQGDNNNSNTDVAVNKNSMHISNNMDSLKKEISKVSTKELIDNYLKVKEDYIKDFPSKMAKKDKKANNFSAKVDSSPTKQDWNNKSVFITTKSPIAVFRNQTHHKNMFTIRSTAPASARIEGVENDRDVDSYMSLTAPSPRIIEIDNDDDKPADVTRLNNGNIKVQEIPNDEGNPEPSTSTLNKNIDKDKDLQPKELNPDATVLDIYSMLKEIESFGDNPVTSVTNIDVLKTEPEKKTETEERQNTPKDNFMEIFEFLEKVEQSANDALSVVTTTTPHTIPKLEALLKLPQTELAQRLVTASLQLEERSCCIALLQESLANNKEQMVNKISNLEKQSIRNISKVKQECEEAIKRHQSFIDQLINDKKTLNHRIEQLVDERRSLEERWKRSAQALEDRYKLELRNQHDKMVAQQQVARQRWVRQKAEKIKELTVKGLEGELREMAERQQKEIADIKMYHAEQNGRLQARHQADMEELRNCLLKEKEEALAKERQMASARLEKQILELEVQYQEQRTRLVAEMRAENERVASSLTDKERLQRHEIEKWRQDQERLIEEKRKKLEQDRAKEREKLEEQMKLKQEELERKFEQYKREFEADQNVIFKKKVTEIAAQHKLERDREIEKAIESMEAEAQAGRRELQEALRRNKEQYESELRELAETEQATLNRYKDAQARIRQTESRCAEMEVSINQLETRNKLLIEKNSQLEKELAEVRSRCDEAWQKTVDDMKRSIEESRKLHEEQMHQLYAKVKVAVARKDSAIQALTREAGKYKEKIAILEQKLQQQRKDFLKQK